MELKRFCIVLFVLQNNQVLQKRKNQETFQKNDWNDRHQIEANWKQTWKRNQTTCLVFQLLKLFGLKIEKTLIVFSKKSFSFPFLWVEQKMGDSQKNGHIYFSSPCWCNFFSSSAKITLFYFCLKDQLLGIGWLFLKFY